MKRIIQKKTAVMVWLGMLLFGLNSCLEIDHSYTMVAPGVWRGLLDLRDQATLPPHPDHTDTKTKFDFSKTPNGVLPFNFEVTYPSPDSMQIFLINGKEKVAISSYEYVPMIKGETGQISLFFPLYDTHIEAKVEAGVMEGNWIVDYKQNYSIPFKAYLGHNFLFTEIPEPPSIDISGNWTFTSNDDNLEEFSPIQMFQQDGSTLKANVGDRTVDSTNASGEITGNNVFISTFNGLNAHLYEGKIITQDSILGAFYSGNHFRTTWEGHRD